MRKVFCAYALSDHTDSDAEAFLNLPASPYEILDAMDKLRLSEGSDVKFRVDEYYRFGSLVPFLSEPNDLYALNALAQKLSELDDRQEIAFEGLLKMEIEKKGEPCWTVMPFRLLSRPMAERTFCFHSSICSFFFSR